MEGSTEPLPDLGTLSDDDLKALIDKLTQEENDVSFRRRLLQAESTSSGPSAPRG